MRRVHFRPADWVALGVIALGLLLRLREPFSSPVIGAEDPYLRMKDAWDLAAGRGAPEHYPPGFAILLAPFTWLGSTAFYYVGRFLPPLWGAAQVAGVYLLARGRMGDAGALGAAVVVALMPENVFRTNLLFPTALDLAVIPFVFLLVLRAADGSRRALYGALGLCGALLVTHPWVIALLAPTLLAFSLWLAARSGRRAVPVVAASLGGVAALALALSLLPGTWNPAPAFLQNAGPRLVELVVNPASLLPLPMHVNLPVMLTPTAIALGVAGAVAALFVRTRVAILALVWTLLILPFVLVDWFDVWFIPHRSVAYMSIGVALLAGVAIDAAARLARRARAHQRMPRAARGALVGATTVVVAALMLPSALGVGPWYRLYDEDDYEAWHAVAAREPARVITGSWQSAEGFTAITGEAATFNPTFFKDGGVRDAMMAEERDTIVIIDKYARESDLPRGFLDGWEKIGEWGGTRAYRPW